MIPCLYGQDETQFLSNGIGKLSDAISCSVKEKRNGSFELTMTYPAEGIHAGSLIEENIIVAKPSEHGNPQPFRIYKITTPLNGILEICARHIQYQQNQISVSPFTAHGAQAAMSALKTNAATDCPFTFQTDITKDADFTLTVPSTIRNCLGNMDNSILELFGGEFEWDGYTTILHAHRGADHGVRIVYGKNLIDFQMEKSIESMVTGVHPFWYKKDDETEVETLIELPEKVMTLDLGQTYEKIEVLDCSSVFTNEPTLEEIRDYARLYLQDEKFSRPDADITVSFAMLWQTPGYEDIAEAESVSLCDTVHVYITKLNTEIGYTVTETDYNVLLEKYNSIVLSNASVRSKNKRNSFVANMVEIQNQAASASKASASNANKLKQISHKFEDEARGLASSIEMNASHLRTEFTNKVDGLSSKFEQTAEHFQFRLEDAKRQLSSQMELTAYHLQTDFNDKLNGLHSEFEITAQHLRTDFTDYINELSSHFELTAQHLLTQFSDDKNQLYSAIEMTAAHLRTGFMDRANELYSHFELTAQHLETTFDDKVRGLSSSFEITAEHLRTEFKNTTDHLQAEFEVNAEHLNYATTKADENGRILAAAGLSVSTNGNILYNLDIENGVGAMLRNNSDAIGTVVGYTVRDGNRVYFVKAGEVVDSINAQTGQTIHKVDMDMITLRSGAIIKAINGGGNNASEVTIDFNKLNLTSGTVIKLLNGGQSGDSTLIIEADKLDLTGCATVGSLNTEKGRIDNLISGTTQATKLWAATMLTGDLEVGTSNSGTFKYKGNTISTLNALSPDGTKIQAVLGIMRSPDVSSGLSALKGAFNSCSASSNNGVITLTFGKLGTNESSATVNFNMADTQYFRDAVSAARPTGIQSSLTLGSGDIGTSSKYITVFCADDEEYDFPINIDASAVYRAGRASVTPIVYFNGYEKQDDDEWETVAMDNHTIYLEPGEYSNVYIQYYNYSTSSWVTKMGKYEAKVGQGTCTFAYRYSNIGTQFQVHINGVSSGLYGVLEYDDGYVYMRDADTGYDYARVYVANLV